MLEYLKDKQRGAGLSKLAWRWNNPAALYHIYKIAEQAMEDWEDEDEANPDTVAETYRALGGDIEA
jgi:hypothetical protein